MGLVQGRIRLKGLFAYGLVALALGYVVPTIGVASGPVTPVTAIAAAPAEERAVTIPRRAAFLQPLLHQRVDTQPIVFSTREVPDPGLLAGTSVVDAPGVVGTLTVRIQDALEDGAVVDSTQLAVETAPASERVVRVGTRQPAPPSPPPPAQGLPADPTVNYVAAIAGSATSYCLTGTTATGTQAGPGSIAVDPTVIRLGSHLYVPGYGYGYAVDTGGAIKGTIVDLWLTCDAAVRWGRRPVTIYVLAS